MLSQFLSVLGFLAVICRGATLALAALVVGGIAFSLINLRSLARASPEGCGPALGAAKRWIVRAAVALAVTQAFWLWANSAVLMETAGIRFSQVWGANFFLSGVLMAASACAIALAVRRAPSPPVWLIGPAAAILAAEVMTSHAAARLANQGRLIAMTALHQGATALWIGGLLFWLLAIKATGDFSVVRRISRRFSVCAQISVAVLLSAGIGLAVSYVPSAGALIGTSYGLMAITKIVLFASVLLLGALNYSVVHGSGREAHSMLQRLRRFGEAEIGIGFTAIFAAASLTSLPPAVDMVSQQIPVSAIWKRISPRLPRMETPSLNALSPSTREAWKDQQRRQATSQPYIPGTTPYVPPNEGDIAWSEYNHHWAGLIVLIAGLLAVLSRTGYAAWARHWPLAFGGLAVFLFVRADPENWPLGPSGFWESFSSVDVLQHRLFVVLILGFTAFEWGVQTGRLRSAAAPRIFPLVCAAGGALLLTHSHALANVQEEAMGELSHIPLAIFAVFAGWARWLEMSLSRRDQSIPACIWPLCLALLGTVLLLYREA